MALVTLAEYKTYYSINSTTNDTRLTLLVDLVSELIDSYLGREITEVLHTDEKQELFSNLVYIDNMPISSITSVFYYSLATDDWVEIPAGDLEYNSGAGIIEILEPSHVVDTDTSRSRPIKVTYTGGYASTPADLKLAVFDLITYYNKRQQIPTKSFNNSSLDASSTISGSEMPPHIKRVLSLYRVID